MKIYDFTDDICEVYVLGPILGAWQSFHRFIAARLFGETADQLLTEPEKKLHNAFMVAVGGQDDMTCPRASEDTIPSEPVKMRRILFSVGNSYLGRFNKEKCIKMLTPLNEYLKENDCRLFLIRGGNDNPSYFSEKGLGLSNITPLPDYSVVSVIYGPKLLKVNILCVGGETPMANSSLRKLEKMARRIPGQEDIRMTWENTGFHFDQSEVDKLKDMDIKVLLTSTSVKGENNTDEYLPIMDVLGQVLIEDEDICKLVNKEVLPSLNDWITIRTAFPAMLCPKSESEEPKTPKASRLLERFTDYFMLPCYDEESGTLYNERTRLHVHTLAECTVMGPNFV